MNCHIVLAFKFLSLDTLQHLQRLLNTLMELCHRSLIIFHRNSSSSSHTNDAVLSCVAGDLDLECQWSHVLDKTAVTKFIDRDTLLFGPFFAFFQTCIKTGESSDKDWNGEVVKIDSRHCYD